jgi:phosphate-selective porin OprO and OprP
MTLSNSGAVSAAWLAALLASISASALAQTAAPPAPPSDPREARIEQLEAEVRQLAAEVQDLKNSQAAQIQTLEGVEKRPLPEANAVIANGKPAIISADGRFSANFHAIMQFDVAQYLQDTPGPVTSDFRRDGPALGASASNVDLAHARHLKNGDDFRRARIGVDGSVFGDWDYRLLFDFAGTGTENAGQLYETWVQYSGLKPLRFRVGAFPPSVGLDDQASTNGMPFLERSVVEDVARGLAASDTRTAAQIWAASDHWLASAAITGRVIGVINTGTASPVPQTFSDQLAFVGRLAGTPFYGDDWLVHLGVHGSYVIRPADANGPTTAGPTSANSSVVSLSNTPELRVDATKFVNTGNIPARHADTLGAELALQKQNFLLQAEYENIGVDRSDGLASPDFSGFYISGSWLITGDRRQYNASTAAFDAPLVLHPFQFNGSGWGALELALRYSELNLNYRQGAAGTLQTGSAIRGGDEQNFTVGLNWFPNSVVKFMVDYAHVRIDRLSPATSANAAKTIWFTPSGAQIGQDYDAFEMRSQFAF